MRVVIILLLCVSALGSGVMVLGSKAQTLETFTCLRQTAPDFAIIAMDLQTQNWDYFQQSHQNALDAGYKHVHVLIASWQSIQPGNLPSSFSGRVWITGLSKSYQDTVTMVEDIGSQGYNVGLWSTINWAYYLEGVTPSILSSLPFALEPTEKPWVPFAGWQCPTVLVGEVSDQCTELVTSVSINPTCI